MPLLTARRTTIGRAPSAPTLRQGLLSTARSLVDLFEPVCCAGCGRHGTAVCAMCARPLAGSGHLVRCPEHLLPGPRHPQPVPVSATAEYAGPMRALVTAWKDHGRRDCSPWLSRALASAVMVHLDTLASVVLVPVPSRRAGVRRRGADVVQILARDAAAQLCDQGMAVSVVAALQVSRRLADQAALSARARGENVHGAFSVIDARLSLPAGARVIVVDDVVTTGASTAEAMRALRGVGVHADAVAAVCATPKLLSRKSHDNH